MDHAEGMLSAERGEARSALAITIAGFAASLVCIMASPEGIHHFDDVTHFLYARWAWKNPAYLLDLWGRPGFTVLYAPLAGIGAAPWIGWIACRILSAGLSSAAGWFSFRIAEHAGMRNAWAAALFAWLEPLFFQLSQTTLTETPLAFYVSGALLLALRGRWGWSSLILSAGMVTRHEAVVFLPIWVFFAWLSDGRSAGAEGRLLSVFARIGRLWPVVVAPFLVNAIAWVAGLTPALVVYLRPKPSTQYGSDAWEAFFARAIHAWGPAVNALAWAGVSLLAIGMFSGGWRGVRAALRERSGFARGLVVVCIVTYFGAQTVIRVLGLFDSGGYARFLVPIGPLVAVAGLAAWNGLMSYDTATRRRAMWAIGIAFVFQWVTLELQMRSRHGIGIEFPLLTQAVIAMRIMTAVMAVLCTIGLLGNRGGGSDRRSTGTIVRSAGHHAAGPWLSRWATACGLVAIMGFTAFIFVRPLHPPPEAAIIDEAFASLRMKGLGDRPVISAVCWIDYLKDAGPPSKPLSTREKIEQATTGSLIFWEKQFAGGADHGIGLVELVTSPSFRPVLMSRARVYETLPYLTVFEKIGAWGRARQ